MAIYRGVNGVNRKIVKQFRGVDGANREILHQFRGVNGVNREVFGNGKIFMIYDNGLSGVDLSENDYSLSSYYDGLNRNAVSFGAGHINMKVTTLRTYSLFGLESTINLDDYSKLVVEYQSNYRMDGSAVNTSLYIKGSKRDLIVSHVRNMNFGPATANEYTVQEFDISGVTGNQYISFNIRNAESQVNRDLDIYRIYLK